MNRRKERGMATLLALLVVLAILMVLAAMSVAPARAAWQLKNENSAIATMQAILDTANAYYGQHQSYPPTTSFLTNLAGCGTCSPMLPTELDVVTPATVNNYTYTVTLPSGATQDNAFLVRATPVNSYQGRKSFCVGGSGGSAGMDQSIMVHFQGGIATPSSLADCINPGGTWATVNVTGQGPAGPPGPVHAYYTGLVAGTNMAYTSSGTVVATTTTLPAGTYAVTTQFSYIFNSSTTATTGNLVQVWMVGNYNWANSGNGYVSVPGQTTGTLGAAGSIPMSFQVTLSSPGTLSMMANTLTGELSLNQWKASINAVLLTQVN